MNNRKHPAQRGRIGLQLMRPFERAQARTLDEILGVVPVARYAQRKGPQARQHFGKHAW
jgi:hypothetical protein